MSSLMSEAAIRLLLDARWGLPSSASALKLSPLPSYEDANWRAQFLGEESKGREDLVVKITARETREELEMQHGLLARLPLALAQRPIPTLEGKEMIETSHQGQELRVRLVRFLPGREFAHAAPFSSPLLSSLGRFMANMHEAFRGYQHPNLNRHSPWDLRRLMDDAPFIADVPTPANKELARAELAKAPNILSRVSSLPIGIIHGDLNDWNLLTDEEGTAVTGVLDFGDAIAAPDLLDLAICAAYCSLPSASSYSSSPSLSPIDPSRVLLPLIRGYSSVAPLSKEEIFLLFPLLRLRLLHSVLRSSHSSSIPPLPSPRKLEYILISQSPAWAFLHATKDVDPEALFASLSSSLSSPSPSAPTLPQDLAAFRRDHLAENIRPAYCNPVKIVKARGSYMWDETGRRFLDAYTNVAHVGHTHPRVQEAVGRVEEKGLQAVSTRYLTDEVDSFLRTLLPLLPPPLANGRVFFCASGTEANDLAVRLAQSYSSSSFPPSSPSSSPSHFLVLSGAYHGHSPVQIELSPYKWPRPTPSSSVPPHVHVIDTPDFFRGPFRNEDGRAVQHYVQQAAAVLSQHKIAAFFAESSLSCGGQHVLPPGYLDQIYALVRAQGGICVADEIQVGLGRLGGAFWGFQLHDPSLCPDILTLGKGIANGYPLGLLICTQEVAASIPPSMEFFSTFGGNPVSLAASREVLSILQSESLVERAKNLGHILVERLNAFKSSCTKLGDVRGSGLFVGIEFVDDRASRRPDKAAAKRVVEHLKEVGSVLCGTDGLDGNVIKVKPPMSWDRAEMEWFLYAFKEAINAL